MVYDMSKMIAIILVVMCFSSLTIGQAQTLGLKIGTLYERSDERFSTERVEVSFAYPVMQNLEASLATGSYSNFIAESHFNYNQHLHAVPILAGVKYTFMINSYAPYVGVDYGDVIIIRENIHPYNARTVKLGAGLQYRIRESLLLDISIKDEKSGYFSDGFELMAGFRIPL
jgi:hypothetical protein